MPPPVASSIFTPSSGARVSGKTGPMKSALSSAIPVPVLPENIAQADRLKYLMALAAIGTSSSASVASWKVYILAYTAALFPQLSKEYQKDIYRPVTMTNEDIQAVIAAVAGLDAIPEDQAGDVLAPQEQTLNSTPVGPGLPMINPVALTRHLADEAYSKVIAGHYALLLFMAGKRIEGEDHSAMTQKRPEALIKKAHMDWQPHLLIGSLRYSDSSHLHINSAWQELAALRSLCFRTFARFEEEATDDIQDMIYTTMHLLKYNGMQHAKIVHGFLQAYPWADEVPALRTAVAQFKSSIIAAAKYPKDIQPYIKLIYGDKSTIFPRKEMEVLISCAVAASIETSPDLVGFYTSDAFTSIVEAFLAERENRGNIRTLKVGVQKELILSQFRALKKSKGREEINNEQSSSDSETTDDGEDEGDSE